MQFKFHKIQGPGLGISQGNSDHKQKEIYKGWQKKTLQYSTLHLDLESQILCEQDHEEIIRLRVKFHIFNNRVDIY